MFSTLFSLCGYLDETLSLLFDILPYLFAYKPTSATSRDPKLFLYQQLLDFTEKWMQNIQLLAENQ